MGIKGVYGEIGPGRQTSLVKLAVDKKEQTNKNFRIAVDISIWLYQVQLGQGGTNADLRNLFYRCLRLLRLSIEPVFVFDGPHKPPFKRNKKTNVVGGSGLSASAKRLCDVFGFPYITAPGEAEAECALLQKEGVVDAVLSEDVDTLMFGCTMHLRNWDLKGKASHVDVYRASETKAGKSGLDREGMVLIALMSGGDYTPAGIPNCGIKTACEAARAGFGHDLMKIDRKDTTALRDWRDRLQHELHTNESKFFRTKHKTLQIPEIFPDKAVLYYYTNPVVSTAQQVEKYRQELTWREPDVQAFWEATTGFFDWRGREGLRHFIRNFAPALVGWRLANGYHRSDSYDDIDVQSANEEQLVKTISGRRTHPSADDVPELRIAYIPSEVVGMTLESLPQEELDAEQAHTALYSGDEEEVAQQADDTSNVPAKKKRVIAAYDPTNIEKDWFPETFVKLGVPVTVEKWEAEMRDPKKFASRKARARQKEKDAMPKGSIEKYLHVSKPGLVAELSLSMRAKSIEASRKTNVSSTIHSLPDESLTKPDISTPSITAPPRKTVSRSKLPSNSTAKKVSSMIGHTRVTKPGSQLFSSPDKIRSVDLDQFVSGAESSAGKHARSPSPTRSRTKRASSSSTHVVVAKLENTNIFNQPHRIFTQSSKTTLLSLDECFSDDESRSLPDVEIADTLHVSIEVDDFISPVKNPMLRKHRSPISRTISAPTQSRSRPAYNQWTSMDDFDSSFETPKRLKNKTTGYVDLTLS